MGRFISPDWSAKVAPVPYAKLYDPQTLNLYAYVGNNPTDHLDADGHASACGWTCRALLAVTVTVAEFAVKEGWVRSAYNAAKSQNPGMDTYQRSALQAEMQNQSTPLGRAIAETHAEASALNRRTRTADEIFESAKRLNPRFNTAGRISAIAGPVLAVATAGFIAYDIYSAPKSERGRVAAGDFGGLAGAWLGGRIGQVLGVSAGAETGPGAVATGVIGGVGGAIMGEKAGRNFGKFSYDAYKVVTQ
jgi:hypothetical protein